MTDDIRGATGAATPGPWTPHAPDDMPRETPTSMPVQALDHAPDAPPPPRTSPPGMTERRLLLVLGTLVIGTFGAGEITRSLSSDGISGSDVVLMLLFFALFAWIAFGFLNAFAGFLLLVSGRSVPTPAAAPQALPTGRTAILLPVHNEEVEPVFARLRAMARSVAAAGGSQLFEIFVLSDSRPEREAAEHRAFRRLRGLSPLPIWYRRRTVNEGRKPGNIADWVRRHGGGYDYMLVLDADSLMSGAAVMRLAAAMDRHPQVALLQTIPMVIGGETLFARWQQFAARLYGPVFSAGLLWWSGAESSFWGHNAIIRVAAFAESCGLPKLSGPEPFGGHVMSHDMYEAGLLRRRGWACHMVAMQDGTYEEYPPTFVEHAARDRRWCQGNLQHLRVLDTAGLHWVSRLQLLMGASAYLTSPLWLMLLAASAIVAVHSQGEIQIIAPSGWLLGLTLVLLFAPKFMALGWMLADPMRRGGFGGGWALIKSVGLDIPLGVLVAPMMMLTQTLAVIDILRGRPSGWAAQNRVSDGIALSDAARHYRWHLIVGGAMAAAALLGLQAAVWMAPIFAGLLAAPLLVTWTSRASLGQASARHGLFLIPEERRPNPLIRDAQPGAEDRSEPTPPTDEPRWPALRTMLPRRQPS
ncbi:glucans biosynthesis glucosyltransferase MdoH [uncultured Sphingomonas sp.]|uniref:glucans biosynthesis glucosyltransferase MdoH n=1 Tax=uncultured Sphingomonas sp. TaxID=158754 RepID=UPI002635CA3F|nr:glucans biosynthesis glucosyltransferase MdoH [uncultured Sphingomonas sp.]